MNYIIPLVIDYIVPKLFFYKDSFSIKLPTKVDNPINKEPKPHQTKKTGTGKRKSENIGSTQQYRNAWFGLVWFYDISTIESYLMPNPVYSYIIIIIISCW